MDHLDVVQELMRREVEEGMQNRQARALMTGLGVKFKNEQSVLARDELDGILARAGSPSRKPTGRAAAEAQAAWDTL